MLNLLRSCLYWQAEGVNQLKIIAVDDEISALHVILNEIIELRDIEYRFFKDDVESIMEYVAANRIDAAFLDINMPNINGLELAEKLLKISPEIKFVFITGLAASMGDLDERIKRHTVGFLYKPFDRGELLKYISEIGGSATMTVKTFGSFECFIGDNIVPFSSAKSKELFALLITYYGKSLTMTDAISQLWPDHDREKAKKLYRDAVWRLRKTLRDVGFNCVVFGRANLTLIKDDIRCDMWDYVEGERSLYNGEYLKSYDWSVYYQSALDALNK